MNLYKFYDKPETLDHHDQLNYIKASIFWTKYKNELPDLEDKEAAIATSAKCSCLYARYVLKGPFELGEATIAKIAGSSFYYAVDVLKGPFKAGEAAIAKSTYAADYTAFLKTLK